MEDKVQQVHVEDEFKVCTSCGYKDGFHSMLKKDKGRFKWLFICPACHAVFDVGFSVGDGMVEGE